MNVNMPKVESRANNDSIKSHAVILDGKELKSIAIQLFCAGNGTRTYVVVKKNSDGSWKRVSPGGMKISQARNWIQRRIYEDRKREAAK